MFTGVGALLLLASIALGARLFLANHPARVSVDGVLVGRRCVVSPAHQTLSFLRVRARVINLTRRDVIVKWVRATFSTGDGTYLAAIPLYPNGVIPRESVAVTGIRVGVSRRAGVTFSGKDFLYAVLGGTRDAKVRVSVQTNDGASSHSDTMRIETNETRNCG
jgi:hypothetical protein